MPAQTPDDATQRLVNVFSRNIRRRRRSARLTQQQLAKHAKMHWRHLQKIEKGEVNATLQTITRIAGALNVDPSTLFMGHAPANAVVKRRPL